MARTTFDTIGTLKAMQWELAKGHLRSLVALEGSASSGESERPYRFETIAEHIETFVKGFEDEGLHK